jgi:tRNA G26 N,N-dimethylase Trm1
MVSFITYVLRVPSGCQNSALLYSRRDKKSQVECIDLDPYGTVSPFIDGAVQAVADGGRSTSIIVATIIH